MIQISIYATFAISQNNFIKFFISSRVLHLPLAHHYIAHSTALRWETVVRFQAYTSDFRWGVKKKQSQRKNVKNCRNAITIFICYFNQTTYSESLKNQYWANLRYRYMHRLIFIICCKEEAFQNRLTQLVWVRVIYSDSNSINSTKIKRYSRPRQRCSNTRVMTLRLLNANRRVNEI